MVSTGNILNPTPNQSGISPTNSRRLAKVAANRFQALRLKKLFIVSARNTPVNAAAGPSTMDIPEVIGIRLGDDGSVKTRTASRNNKTAGSPSPIANPNLQDVTGPSSVT